MYFAALCRCSASRSGRRRYHSCWVSKEPTSGLKHHLVGYGRVPVDVTIAEGGTGHTTRHPIRLHRWKEHDFGSLDRNRDIIQNDVDIPIVPDPGNAVMFRMVVQSPKIACDTCNEDVDLLLTNNWTTVVKRGGTGFWILSFPVPAVNFAFTPPHWCWFLPESGSGNACVPWPARP